MSPVVITLLSTALPLVLMASLVPTILAQLRGPTHPTVLVTDAFAAAFVLILLALVTPMPVWVQLIWWIVLLTCLIGVAASTVRLLRAPSAGGASPEGRASPAIGASPEGRASPAIDAPPAVRAPAQSGPLPHAVSAPGDEPSPRTVPTPRAQLSPRTVPAPSQQLSSHSRPPPRTLPLGRGQLLRGCALGGVVLLLALLGG